MAKTRSSVTKANTKITSGPNSYIIVNVDSAAGRVGKRGDLKQRPAGRPATGPGRPRGRPRALPAVPAAAPIPPVPEPAMPQRQPAMPQPPAIPDNARVFIIYGGYELFFIKFLPSICLLICTLRIGVINKVFKHSWSENNAPNNIICLMSNLAEKNIEPGCKAI